MKRRKLPIGGYQSFRKLRNECDVYIDKTMHLYELASRSNAVFLARPRRFGKSLLCSTIESLFLGEKELFEELAISQTDWQWKEHPVIHFDMSAENYAAGGVERLKEALGSQLDAVCDRYGVLPDRGGSIPDRFSRTIAALSEQRGPVVVIVDEYDSPLLNTIDKPTLSAEIRDELRGFFGVIKKSDQHLRFTFVTGITKFAQISMFSDFNQPIDISMMPDFGDICGITQEELERDFAPEIEAFAPKHGGREAYLARLKTFYNGYYFTREMTPVYNTYGILNHFFSYCEFEPYWSISGTPSFARKYLEMKDVDIVDIETAEMQASDFADYKDDTITLFPLLYQAGYLTISEYDERSGIYKLTYPNVEIRQSLAKFLASNYSKADKALKNSTSQRLVKSLLDGKPDDFMALLKPYLDRVDYSLSSRITEHYFEFAVSNIINMLGLECKNEVHTANGRMDSVIHAGDYIYIFEFKVDKPIEDALWQLDEKDYASVFSGSGKKVIEIGVVFSREMRSVVEWELKY